MEAESRTRIRGAIAADAAAIGETHARAWETAYAEVFTPAALAQAVEQRRHTGERLVAQLRADGEVELRDGSFLLVAEVDGSIVGFTHSAAGRNGFEVFALYAHPDHWGSDVSRALWAATLAQSPATTGSLWTLAGAGRARAFYDRVGWSATGRAREHDFGIGQIVTIVEHVGPTA
ncbi:hypothetical protein GCM10027425_05520 [Alteromonas gracilis]